MLNSSVYMDLKLENSFKINTFCQLTQGNYSSLSQLLFQDKAPLTWGAYVIRTVFLVFWFWFRPVLSPL